VQRSINPFHINRTPNANSSITPYRPPGTAKSHGERLLQAEQAKRPRPPAPSPARDDNAAAPARTPGPRPSPINSGSFYGDGNTDAGGGAAAAGSRYGTPRPDGLRTYSRKTSGGVGGVSGDGGAPRAPTVTRVGADLGLGVRGNTLWACQKCTLHNNMSESMCGVCGTWRYSTGAPAMSRPTIGGM
jgi:hypothetical protein